MAASAGNRSARKPIFGRAALLAMLVLGLACAIAAVALWRRAQMKPPPVLGTLPPFALTDQQAEPFGSDQLQGKVWIANFIFTRCPTVCPVFSQKMAVVQKRTRGLGAALRLVSFSVDPDWDTPERLHAYAERFGADHERWKFLTGAPEQIRLTVSEGLKIAMEQQGMDGDVPNIIHGTHFVVIDQQLRIRGYYASDDTAEIDRMVREVGWLTQHPD